MDKAEPRQTLLPTGFPEAGEPFKKPKDWDDEKDGVCKPLPVWTDGRSHVSLWKAATWRDRLKFLWTGEVWLGMVCGFQPPVWVEIRCPFPRRPVLSRWRRFKHWLNCLRWGTTTE